jgi:hypothetical protein
MTKNTPIATNENILKVIGWIIVTSLFINGMFLKKTLEKIDEMKISIEMIERKIIVLEERQNIYLIERNVFPIDKKNDKRNPLNIPSSSRYMIKSNPFEYKNKNKLV